MLGRTVSSVRVERLEHGPPAATAGLWRVEADGQRLVLKLLHAAVAGHRRWPAAPDLPHPYYWRREALAYGSGLLATLPGPLRAPRCHACVERPEGAVAVWLEHVDAVPARAWELDRYELAARHLGRAQGAIALGPPDEPWLSRGWLRAYLELRRGEVDAHGAGPTRRLWEERESALGRLDRLPRTLCHLDLYPANLFGDGEETVLVDWAYCGLGAVGEDAGSLVPDALLDGFVGAGDADELERLVWGGYLAGLRDAGWGGDERDVRLAFVLTAGLKYAWIPAALAAGTPPRATAERWRRIVPLLEERAVEARRLASPT